MVLNYILSNLNYQYDLFMKLPSFNKNFLTVLYDALFANDIWQKLSCIFHYHWFNYTTIVTFHNDEIFNNLSSSKFSTYNVIIIPIKIKTYNKEASVSYCFIVSFHLSVPNIFEYDALKNFHTRKLKMKNEEHNVLDIFFYLQQILQRNNPVFS